MKPALQRAPILRKSSSIGSAVVRVARAATDSKTDSQHTYPDSGVLEKTARTHQYGRPILIGWTIRYAGRNAQPNNRQQTDRILQCSLDMRSNRYLSLGLVALIMLEAVALWILAWRDTHGVWDVDAARIAIRRIENNRQAGLQGTVQEAIISLDEVASCYADWQWQRADLDLGGIVEERRAAAVREIVDNLRNKTGKDFGYAPQKWMEASEAGILGGGGQPSAVPPKGEEGSGVPQAGAE